MDEILQFVAQKGQVTARDLLENIKLPRRTLFLRLALLVEEGRLIKIGNRPHVLYALPGLTSSPETPPIDISQAPTSDPVPALEQPIYSAPLLYWCKFLRLDPKAVTESYHQIRPLVPNYQSIGMSPPKSKQLGLKMPDPIWVRFFNLLTWILAIFWTILKNRKICPSKICLRRCFWRAIPICLACRCRGSQENWMTLKVS